MRYSETHPQTRTRTLTQTQTRTPTLLLLSPFLFTLACSPPDPDRFAFATQDAFDAGTIPAYTGDHAAIYANIDQNLDAHVAHIQRWLRQPSISAQNVGIAAMAALVRDDLLALGFQEAELVPTSGHPGVWGWYDAGAAKTLLIYLMYDVQPVEPADWRSPPFKANLVDHELGTVVMARGATNQKGPERALLNAI